MSDIMLKQISCSAEIRCHHVVCEEKKICVPLVGVTQGWPTCGACAKSGALEGSWWRIAVGENIQMKNVPQVISSYIRRPFLENTMILGREIEKLKIHSR